MVAVSALGLASLSACSSDSPDVGPKVDLIWEDKPSVSADEVRAKGHHVDGDPTVKEADADNPDKWPKVTVIHVKTDAIDAFPRQGAAYTYYESSIDDRFVQVGRLPDKNDVPQKMRPNPDNPAERGGRLSIGREDSCFAAVGIADDGEITVLPTTGEDTLATDKSQHIYDLY